METQLTKQSGIENVLKCGEKQDITATSYNQNHHGRYAMVLKKNWNKWQPW